MMHLWSNNLPDAGGNNPTSSSSNETHELNINVNSRTKNGNSNSYFTRSPQNLDSSAKFELAGGGAGSPRSSDPSSMQPYTVLRDGGPATAAAANTLNGGLGAYQTVMSTGDDGPGAGGGGSSGW